MHNLYQGAQWNVEMWSVLPPGQPKQKFIPIQSVMNESVNQHHTNTTCLKACVRTRDGALWRQPPQILHVHVAWEAALHLQENNVWIEVLWRFCESVECHSWVMCHVTGLGQHQMNHQCGKSANSQQVINEQTSSKWLYYQVFNKWLIDKWSPWMKWKYEWAPPRM